MSDVHATAFRYDSICTELGVSPNPYVVKMFDREKDESVLAKEIGEDRENMYLYLAGNNKLLTNSDARLTDRDCEVLYKLLCNNLFVTSLDLRYNNITDEGAKFIAALIEETSCLEHINLMFNDIGETGAAVIAKSLHKNETLKSLQITGNKIGNRGGMYFAQMLQINTSLEALDLGDTDMTIEAIIALATVLNQNRSLRVLNMNRPLLFTHQEEHTVHVANMLKVNVSLLELHLQKYELRDFGATRLAENLMDNLSLTHLDLSCNRITRDGAKELAKVLKRNTELKVLDLGYNRLEDDGAIYLAEAIGMYNTKLETLVVSYNNIGGKGLCALADSMKLNSSIAAVFIWGNNLQESACIAFAGLISSGRLKKEDTDVQPYVVDGVTKLCELNHSIHRHYYYAPSYGDDVPHWQPKGKNPRGSDIVVVRDRGVPLNTL